MDQDRSYQINLQIFLCYEIGHSFWTLSQYMAATGCMGICIISFYLCLKHPFVCYQTWIGTFIWPEPELVMFFLYLSLGEGKFSLSFPTIQILVTVCTHFQSESQCKSYCHLIKNLEILCQILPVSVYNTNKSSESGFEVDCIVTGLRKKCVDNQLIDQKLLLITVRY